jgi:UDP-N-acetylmuramyl pentapeptide phosphotransferase/UDP-N-acetylglucosamine-1-phosphate transferase
METTLIAFLISLISCLLIVRYQHLHNHVTGDNKLSEPQKFHHIIVPRIGGLAILIALLFAGLTLWMQNNSSGFYFFTIILTALPAWLIGISEDLTKKISIRTRFVVTTLSALLAGYFLNSWITRVDVSGLDYILAIPTFSIFFTCVAITGLTNAYNIIDGFNGLASMTAMISLLAITYVALQVGDMSIVIAALPMTGAIAGFFLWNYPRGFIFLGDSGAYLIGFWVATLSILLVTQNAQVSPWFAIVVNCYPIFETLFSIWRKKVYQGKSPGQADATHFHSLIYRRIIRRSNNTTAIDQCQYKANAKTSPYLWFLSSLAVLPATLWWEYTWVLQLSALWFAISYVYLYIRIVKFKIPFWIR